MFGLKLLSMIVDGIWKAGSLVLRIYKHRIRTEGHGQFGKAACTNMKWIVMKKYKYEWTHLEVSLLK